MAPDNGQKKRSRRISRACDYCHRRSIQCRPSADGVNCQNCFEFGQPCTFERQVKRRGVPPKSSSTATTSSGQNPAHTTRSRDVERRSRISHLQNGHNFTPQSPADDNGLSQGETTAQNSSTPPNVFKSYNPNVWKAPHIASQANVMDLAELYFEIVYPIFPLYHQPSFLRKMSRGEYTTKRTLFIDTMAMCALVSARVRDGAVFNPKWDTSSLQDTDPDTFYQEAARQAACHDITPDHNLMRAHAVLAITAIQNGKIRDMHQHLGRYHTLVSMDGLHDEANWPQDIGIVETEERRRLFWSIYTLDVYTSIVWNGVIRCREQRSNVSYPTEMDDELFSDDGFSSRASMSPTVIGPSPSRNGVQVQTTSWLCGWNFITDLYRVLEHVISHFHDRRSRARERSFIHDIFKDDSTVSQTTIRNRVMYMYNNLPQQFKETPPVSYDVRQDRFGFQAANITATVQLLRMVLFTAAGVSIQERCQIANEVIGAFIAVPVAYLQAISSPLIYHLGGIGAILGSVSEEPLSEADCHLVRSVLSAMAQLLSNLEVMHSSAGASEKLRMQIARIDEYMDRHRSAAQQAQRSQLPRTQRVRSNTTLSSVDFGSYGTDGSVDDLVSPFQVPPDLLGDFTWIFDPAQSYG